MESIGGGNSIHGLGGSSTRCFIVGDFIFKDFIKPKMVNCSLKVDRVGEMGRDCHSGEESGEEGDDESERYRGEECGEDKGDDNNVGIVSWHKRSSPDWVIIGGMDASLGASSGFGFSGASFTSKAKHVISL